jgi:hypothetical protein
MIEGHGSARLASDQMLCLHVLAATLRTINHLLCSFFLGAELATMPGKELQERAASGFSHAEPGFQLQSGGREG